MQSHISAANRETGPVIEEANSLFAQKSRVETQHKLLAAFNAHFLVSEAELTMLTSTAEPVNDSFFKILARVKKIHADSQLLLGTENQTLGMEILEQSSKHLNAGYQKLFRWVQREFKTLDLENPQISSSIRRSLRVLAERPALFQNCLDFFAEARERTLSDAFYAALTGTAPGEDRRPSYKPIDFQAHDPVRYVGDMLAWAHSTTVSEREALEVLFIAEGDEIAKGIQSGRENDPWTNIDDEEEEAFDGRKALADLVSQNLSGVARLLKQRVEQTIQSQEDAPMMYRIANLVGFYRITFTKVFGEGTTMLEVLDSLEQTALRSFKAAMRDYVASVKNDFSGAPESFSPPEFLEEALETLKVLMKSYDTSFAAVDNSAAGFEPILTEALDPFLSGCQSLYRRIEEPGNDIFAVNCFRAVLSTLTPFAFTADRQEDVEETMQDYRDNLVKYQHRFFQDISGLHPLLQALQAVPEGEEHIDLSSLEQFKPQFLVDTSQSLDDFLPSAVMDAMENLKQLRDTKMAQQVTEEATELFCQDFEFIESKIIEYDERQTKEANGVNEEDEGHLRLRDCFPRTSAEVRVLLS